VRPQMLSLCLHAHAGICDAFHLCGGLFVMCLVIVHRAVLLSKFIEGSAEDWDYVAAVLTNVTRMPDGRKLLLDPQRGFLRALATQLRSPSLTRRRGCAAAFRNCAFGAQVRKSSRDAGL